MLDYDTWLDRKIKSHARNSNTSKTNLFLRSKRNSKFRNKKKSYQVFMGSILNLNFPSNVRTMDVNGKEVTYGYSSGTYARLNPMFDRVSLLPRQEEIDALGAELRRQDWEKRFELVYQQALNKDVTATMGVTPVILAFARYIKRQHGKKPADLWKPQALFCTSVRKIHYR